MVKKYPKIIMRVKLITVVRMREEIKIKNGRTGREHLLEAKMLNPRLGFLSDNPTSINMSPHY